VSFGIDRRARSRKGKGLFRRAPDPDEVGKQLAFLLMRMKRTTSRQVKKEDRFVAEVTFHPRAPAAKLVVGPDAELSVKAQTSTLGPGYHLDVLERLQPILDELDYVWAEPEPDPTEAMCKWLAGKLEQGDDQLWVGLSGEYSFISDAAVLTAVGPRDEAWVKAVLADPLRAVDAFPWQKAGKGYADLASALLSMWQEVPWREPMDDAETTLMERIDSELAAAHKAGVTDLPYEAWAELLGYLGRDDDAAAKVYKLAGSRENTIGYRRLDMDIALTGDWIVRVPGSFAGRWEDDHTRYLASDGDRAIEFTSLTADGETDSAKLLAVAPESRPVIDRFVDGNRHGRAETSEEDHVHIVHGLVADAPHVAILTLKGKPSDEAWALRTWRSLRRESRT